MEKLDVVVRNGRVFLDLEHRLEQKDIGIQNGKVVSIADKLEACGHKEIDATGLFVLPGGVDSHCHIEQKTSTGLTPCGNFYGNSVSAICGGTTTMVPFACQFRGGRIKDIVLEYRKLAEKSASDYALHVIVTDPSEPYAFGDLVELFKTGISSVKLYMTYDALRLADYDLLDVLALCRRHGAMSMVHAESHDMIRWITDRLFKQGHTLPPFHAIARPAVAEREATHRAVSFAEFVGTPLLIVHVSSPETLEEISRARSRGAPIFAETCPQYLMLTKSCLRGSPFDKFDGARYLCCPPVRDEASQEALWSGLRAGALQVYSSDHSAYRFEDDGSGGASKTMLGRDAPFNKVPMGLPGLETRLALLFSKGVVEGRLGSDPADGEVAAPPEKRVEERIRRFVDVACTNPAKLYGIYPQKGAIALGSDADLVLWDPERETVVSKKQGREGFLHDNLDYTPYEGVCLKGLPVITLLRGRQVFRRGVSPASDELSMPEGSGLFVPASLPDLLGWQPPEDDEWPSERDPVLRRAAAVELISRSTGCA